MRLLPILRRASFILLTLLVALFLFIQFQQRLLRYRAERLHAEILALQLHPGTFADIQRLQHEWGAHAHYNGTCTQHHCIYEINLNDVLQGWVLEHSDFSLYNDRNHRLLQLYAMFGGHPASAGANIRIRENRMWGADFGFYVETYPGKGRNEGQVYAVAVDVDSGTRLLRRQEDFRADLLQQGFRTMGELQCLGCEIAVVSVTPQTDARDIERFNQLDLSCITRWHPCKDPKDMAPELWAQALHDKSIQAPPEEQACMLSPSILTREANDVALVEVLSTKTVRDRSSTETSQSAKVRILQLLKNGRSYRTTDTPEFIAPPHTVRSENSEKSAQLVVGEKYFFLYRQPRPGELESFLYLLPCHSVPDTPLNTAMILKGIAMDPSAGEPYDYRIPNEEP